MLNSWSKEGSRLYRKCDRKVKVRHKTKNYSTNILVSLQSTLYNCRRSLKNTFYFHCILLKILREMKPPVIIWPWLLSLDLLMPLTHDPVKHSAFIFKHSLFRDIFSRPRAYACLTAPVCLLGRVTAALTCLSHTTRTLTAPW